MHQKIFLLSLLALPLTVSAHPGNTDSLGGHHCWTNCASWGEIQDGYHFHNESSPVSASVAATEYTEGSKANISSLLLLSPDTFCSYGMLIVQSAIEGSFDSIASHDKLRMSLEKAFEYQCSNDAQCSFNHKDLEEAMLIHVRFISHITIAADQKCGTSLAQASLDRLTKFIDIQNKARINAKSMNTSSSISQKKSSYSSSMHSQLVKKPKTVSTYKSSASPVPSLSCKKIGSKNRCQCPRGYKASKTGTQCTSTRK